MLSDLEQYLLEGFHKVQGWVAEPIWEVLAFIDHEQRRAGVSGGVAEIGVHHGRFLLGLQALKSDPGTALAIDVFDEQEFNVDNSGRGSKHHFLKNVDTYSIDSSKVEAMQSDSLLIRQWDVSRIRDTHGRFSMFSVDGGHTAAHVFHDFGIAQELTTAGGIIIVDDYNNPWWPGVQEGIARAFLLGSPTFVPLLAGMNKFILTDIGHHGGYLKALIEYFEGFPDARTKVNSRYGWESVSLALPERKSHFETLRRLKGQTDSVLA